MDNSVCECPPWKFFTIKPVTLYKTHINADNQIENFDELNSKFLEHIQFILKCSASTKNNKESLFYCRKLDDFKKNSPLVFESILQGTSHPRSVRLYCDRVTGPETWPLMTPIVRQDDNF